MTENNDKTKEKNAKNAISIFMTLVLIVLISVMILYVIIPKGPDIISDNNYCQYFDQERIDMPDQVFEGTPMTLKFFNLSTECEYYLLYFTIDDTITVANFANVNSTILVLEATQQQYYLIREKPEMCTNNTKIVMLIWINPMEVNG